MFLNFRRDKKGRLATYDEIIGIRGDMAKLMGIIDNTPDEIKTNLTSESYAIYTETLENIYMSRYSWTADFIPPAMLDNIEKFLMRDRKCAILREKRKVHGLTVYNDFFGVYEFTVSRFDPSHETPLTINIKNPYGANSLTAYNFNEFVIIKDFATWKNITHRKSVSSIIHDYASRLALVDAVIEANMQKHRLPIHVKGKIETNNSVKAYFKELYRNALYMFDGGGIDNNFTIEAPMIEYIIDKLQGHKESLMQEFCSMLGISNSQNYSDVYQNIDSVKLNNSFVFNVAQSHFINRKKVINLPLAQRLNLQLHQNTDIFGKVDLVKPDTDDNDDI